MTENDMDAILAARIKGCVARKLLPDGFADRFRQSIHRSRRRFRMRLVVVIVLVAASVAFTVGLVGRKEQCRSCEASLIATQGNRGEEKVSGWMLLSMFRDLFRRNRTTKRKEDE